MTDDMNDTKIRALMIELVDATPPPPTWESIQARLADPSTAAANGGAMTALTIPDLTTPDAAETGDVSDLPVYARHEERRTARWRPIAAVTGAVGALLGGSFALAAFNGNDGASSPEAAVEQFVEAITAEDVIGALESLPPSEREILTDAARDLTAESERLGLTSGLDPSDVSGFDFEVEGLTLRPEQLGEGVVAVHLDGSVVSQSTGAELPLGDAVFRAVNDDASLDRFDSGVADLRRIFDEQDVFVVAVEEDGGWHSSAWYTIAEYLRRDNDQPLPAFGASVTAPVGADSPEQAVERYFQATIDLDLPTALGLMAPGESRVLYDYGPLFFDEALQSKAEYPRTATVDDLQLEVTGDGDTRSVRLVGAAYTVEEPGGDRSQVQFDGECVSYSGTGSFGDGPPETYEDETCRTDAEAGIEEWQWDVGYGATYITVEQDGRWYLSPARSAAATLVDGARLVPDGAMTGQMLDQGAPFGLLFRVTNLLGGFGGYGGYGLYGFGMVVTGESESCWAEIDAEGNTVETCGGGTTFDSVGTPVEPTATTAVAGELPAPGAGDQPVEPDLDPVTGGG